MPPPERQPVDFVVESSDGRVRLLVEAKNARPTSAEWPKRFMRNLLSHWTAAPPDYFVLALRDNFLLWQSPKATDDRPPDVTLDTKDVLAPYLTHMHGSLDHLSESSFELLIQAWLNDLVTGWSEPSPDVKWLNESGFRESVRNGVVRSQRAA